MKQRIEILTRSQLIVLIVFTGAGHFSISITHICGFLASALWLYKIHATDSWDQQRWPLRISFAAFALASIFSVITALNPLQSFEHLKRLFEMAVFFLILNSLSDASLQASLNSLLTKLKVTRAGCLLPAKTKTTSFLSSRDLFIGMIVLSASISAIVGIIQVSLSGLSLQNRVSGTLSTYMTFSGLLMQAALMAAAYLLFRNGKNKWMGFALFLMVTALSLTLTRQAWLGFGTGLLILLAFRKPVWVALLPVVAALIFWISPTPIQERIKSITNLKDTTFQVRLSMWRLGWEIYKDYPVTGCGFHCLLQVRTNYAEHKEISHDYRTLHSNIVQLAVDAGTIGVLAWFFLWVSFFMRTYSLDSEKDPPDRWVLLGSLCAVASFLVGGLFETNFYDSEVVILTYFLMALPFVRKTPAG